MNLIGLNSKINSCTLCPLHEDRTHAVPGEGNPDADLILVGEAPGRNEDLTGKPFCGSAGKILDEALDHIDVNRNDVFITSILKCRPPKNRNPRKEEAATCVANNLIPQFESIDPKIIVLMGLSAIKHVFGKMDIKKEHGTFKQKKGRKYFITYHPAAVLYRRHLMDTLKNDFMILKKNIEG